MMTQTNQPSRNPWLDTLRGIAASWVVIYHLNEVIPREAHLYAQLAGLGYLGVPIFFIISGYCIWAAAQRSVSIGQFCWRRFCRIYPPYFVSLLVVIAACAIRKVAAGTNDVTKLPANVYEWLMTLTITTEPVTSVKTINWVYWSLSYEVFFYLIIAATLIHLRYRFLLIYLLIGLSFIPPLSNSHSFFFFLDNWGLFTLGIGIYSLCFDKRVNSYGLIVVSLLSIAINNSLPIQITAFLAGLTIVVSDRWNSILRRPNILTRVGMISYSLYLLHVPVGCYLLLTARRGIWLDNLPLHILYDFAVLILCIGVSFVFFQLIEKPAIALGQLQMNWFNRSKET